MSGVRDIIVRKDAKQRYTLGIVYEPNKKDTDGEFAKAATIEKACWGFMRKLQAPAKLNETALSVLGVIGKALDEGHARLDVTEIWDDVEKFAGQARLGDQHSYWSADLGEIVECFIAPVAFELEVDGKTEKVSKGTWLLGTVWSEEEFAKIESGERTGLSMGGKARRILSELAEAA